MQSDNLSDGMSDPPSDQRLSQDHRLGEASGVRSSLVAGRSVIVGVVPPREEITKYFIAQWNCVTAMRAQHRVTAPRRIRRENVGRRWSCRQVRTGMSKWYRI